MPNQVVMVQIFIEVMAIPRDGDVIKAMMYVSSASAQAALSISSVRKEANLLLEFDADSLLVKTLFLTTIPEPRKKKSRKLSRQKKTEFNSLQLAFLTARLTSFGQTISTDATRRNAF